MTKTVQRLLYSLGGGTAICVMTPAEWAAVPDNPRQRDTEAHAKKAKRLHLKSPSPAHASTNAAAINGEIVCKLDGHTRSFLWQSGELESPPAVNVTVYSVASLEEAAELYTHFDNSGAVETSADRIFGGQRQAGLNLRSPLLRRMKFANALRIPLGYLITKTAKLSEYEAIQLLSKELLEIDSWEFPDRSLGTASIATALLLLAAGENKDLVHEFFFGVVYDKGRKTEDGRDGIEAYRNVLSKGIGQGWDGLLATTETCIACFNAYKEGRMMKLAKRTSMASLVEKARESTGYYVKAKN